jgi:hypothetical protein
MAAVAVYFRIIDDDGLSYTMAESRERETDWWIYEDIE